MLLRVLLTRLSLITGLAQRANPLLGGFPQINTFFIHVICLQNSFLPEVGTHPQLVSALISFLHELWKVVTVSEVLQLVLNLDVVFVQVASSPYQVLEPCRHDGHD